MNRNAVPTKALLSCLLLALLAQGCAPEPAEAAPQAAAEQSAGAQSVANQSPAAAPAQRPAAIEPARFGEPFAAGVFQNLNRDGGAPESVDLGQVLGRRPIVLFYWIAGNPRADGMFQELQALVDEIGPQKVALYGVMLRRTDRDRAAAIARSRDLGIHVPVLDDEDFRLGQRLRIQSVPNITIIDGEGRLRLTNGASLKQDLEYKMQLRNAIERVAATGTLGTYGFLGRYYPVTELVGQPCPDFKAPLLSTSVEQRWSTMIRDDHVNVLIFWSVDCPHCRTSLPEINDWLKANGESVNVISAATVTNDASRTKTKQFCDVNGFVFPTLVDRDLQIANLFHVTTTPTIVIIGPSGVVDSVMFSGTQDFGRKIEEKKKSLL